MGFEKIYEAGVEQNTDKLHQAMLEYSIDVWKQGSFRYSAAAELAYEGKMNAAEFLIRHGANINYVVMGAAKRGNMDYVKELNQRNPYSPSYDISYVAFGLAMGGNLSYGDELFLIDQQEADPNLAAMGLALGGDTKNASNLMVRAADSYSIKYDFVQNHLLAQGIGMVGDEAAAKIYIEITLEKGGDRMNAVACGAAQVSNWKFVRKLLDLGADINWIAYGAALGGFIDQAEKFRIEDGADIDWVVRGAAESGRKNYVKKLVTQGASYLAVAKGVDAGDYLTSEESKLAFFSFYRPTLFPILKTVLIKNPQGFFMLDTTQNRALAISNYIRTTPRTYSQALFLTDQNCHGMLYLLMMMNLCEENNLRNPHLQTLPHDIWHFIFKFFMPVPLTEKQLGKLESAIEPLCKAKNSNHHSIGINVFFKSIRTKPQEPLGDYTKKTSPTRRNVTFITNPDEDVNFTAYVKLKLSYLLRQCNQEYKVDTGKVHVQRNLSKLQQQIDLIDKSSCCSSEKTKKIIHHLHRVMELFFDDNVINKYTLLFCGIFQDLCLLPLLGSNQGKWLDQEAPDLINALNSHIALLSKKAQQTEPGNKIINSKLMLLKTHLWLLENNGTLAKLAVTTLKQLIESQNLTATSQNEDELTTNIKKILEALPSVLMFVDEDGKGNNKEVIEKTLLKVKEFHMIKKNSLGTKLDTDLDVILDKLIREVSYLPCQKERSVVLKTVQQILNDDINSTDESQDSNLNRGMS